MRTDVIISGNGNPLPLPVTADQMADIEEAASYIRTHGLKTLIENFQIVDDPQVVEEWRSKQRQDVLDTIDERSKKSGHFDFRPEINFTMQRVVSGDQWLIVQKSSRYIKDFTICHTWKEGL